MIDIGIALQQIGFHSCISQKIFFSDASLKFRNSELGPRAGRNLRNQPVLLYKVFSELGPRAGRNSELGPRAGRPLEIDLFLGVFIFDRSNSELIAISEEPVKQKL